MTKSKKLQRALKEPISRNEALQRIQSDPEAYSKFIEFPNEHQEKILEFIQGSRGLPIVYDPFFKKIFNPIEKPERLERFLSCLMNQKIQIINVIPREGTQMIEKGSFVVMDVLVQTEDGSYINVEMQKYGYKFTGERSTCYMSDLVMRQYTKIKAEKEKAFSFNDMKPVYLIVLMEESSKNFKKVAPSYIHHAQYVCDTGAEINFLANYTYISLDIFHSVSHNINSYLDAWLTFLSSDSPDDIIKLLDAYPEFEEYYHDIAIFRTKPKELMNMYSEILAQMDRNTERLMIEEKQQEIEKLSLEIEEKKQEIKEKAQEIEEKTQEIKEKAQEIEEKTQEIEEKTQEIEEKTQEIEKQSLEIKSIHKELSEKDAYIKELEMKLAQKNG